MNVLVVTPMQQELECFLQACVERGFEAGRAAIGRQPVARLPGLGVTLARGGTGKAQFAVQTQHLLDACPDWALVICAGAAGSLSDDLSIGDVVVATATVEHDFDEKFSRRPVPRFDGAPKAIDSLRGLSPPGSFKIHFGVVASGDEDVIDVERRKALHDVTAALAVAWEGAGGARACAFSGVPFVEIRGVTDTANEDAPLAFETNLAIAMRNVAAVITSWLEKAA